MINREALNRILARKIKHFLSEIRIFHKQKSLGKSSRFSFMNCWMWDGLIPGRQPGHVFSSLPQLSEKDFQEFSFPSSYRKIPSLRVLRTLDGEKQEGAVVSDILPVFSGKGKGGCFLGSMSPVESQTIEFDHPQIFIPVDRKHSCY